MTQIFRLWNAEIIDALSNRRRHRYLPTHLTRDGLFLYPTLLFSPGGDTEGRGWAEFNLAVTLLPGSIHRNRINRVTPRECHLNFDGRRDAPKGKETPNQISLPERRLTYRRDVGAIWRKLPWRKRRGELLGSFFIFLRKNINLRLT